LVMLQGLYGPPQAGQGIGNQFGSGQGGFGGSGGNTGFGGGSRGGFAAGGSNTGFATNAAVGGGFGGAGGFGSAGGFGGRAGGSGGSFGAGGSGAGQGSNDVTRTVTVTPTISETIFDVVTSTAQAVDTHTVTQFRNIDAINPEYVRSTVTFQHGVTNRRIQAVSGIDSTTTVRSVNTQVRISTDVVPIVETTLFYNSLTAFVTRVQPTQIYSVITHKKCDLELVTVPSFVNVVLTETLPVFVTNYVTNTITSTAFVTQPATNPGTNTGYNNPRFNY